MDNEYVDKEALDALNEAAKKKTQKSKSKIAATQPAKRTRKPSAIIQILNGDFLNKEFMLTNFNFIFFLLFLLILIVGKGYYGKQLISDVNQNEKKLEDISSDYIEKKAKLQEETKRASLNSSLEGSGLRQTQNPTKVIRLGK